ncbi:phage tail tip lysozyme [Streptococcus thoraltensis]|uniref:phage tail tip lysozyme n=1 Tax=Streptococcus thoraltensis TaxID=55085 RepID=UPI001F55B184|nr:phage tail tip lysozyme [Streptococcus thoraltensis]
MSNKQKDLRNRLVRKRQIKESVKRHNQSSAKKAQREAKDELKKAKSDYRKAKTAIREAEKAPLDERSDSDALLDDLKAAKHRKIDARKIKKKVRKTNPTIGQKARRTGKAVARHANEEVMETAFGQDDTFSDAIKLKHQARQTKATARQAGKVVKKGSQIAYRSAKGTVSVGTKGTKATYHGVRHGASVVKQVTLQANHYVVVATKAVMSGLAPVLSNPITWLVSGVMGFLLIIIILVASIFSSNIIQQDEFSLNQSWLHLSKRDRKESTDKVDYYTDIDSILLYMNYRYGGEWEPDAKWDDGRGGKISGVLGFNHFSDALDDIWQAENKDPNNLKTMAELYTHGKDWIKLSKDELEEYKEILDSQSETGKYLAYQELANPFYSADDEKAESDTITVTRRYGYTDKDTINPTTTIQASGDKLYAPMDGKVTVTKTNLKGKKTKTTNIIISDKDARFIFYDVKNIRVKTDATIVTGVEVGKVSGDTQKIAYAKNYGEVDKKDAKWLKAITTKEVSYGFTEKTKSDNLNTWVLVNPGFYFPFVTYAQQTTVTQEATEMSGRAKQFYDLVKKKLKGATDNGIAAIAGCFGVESGIQPKRAEGDFLSPPVGASPSSWDDDKWLDIPGPAIYGGGYPNILRRGLGMGQFTDTTDGAIRNTLLREYAKKKGKKWYDMELQVDFMLEGDNPYYTKIFKDIATSKGDVDKLTAEFLAKWEGVPGNKLAERQAIAHQALNWFKMDFATGGGSMSIAKGEIAHVFTVPYTVVQPYGKTPWSQGGGAWMYPMGRHSGIDLQGQGFQSGDVSLHSATDGKVSTVSNDPMGGYYVIIEPKFGGIIYYGHMKSATVQKGQTVKKGQRIGVMGTGGGVYHVHFEYNTNIATIGTALSQDKDPGFLIPAKGLTQNQIINPK